jgi:hypothetical protein
MKVLVYVEGPSDRVALEALLTPIISAGRSNRVGIRFIPLGGKAAVLRGAWSKAAADLAQDPGDWMFALPDLYPMVGSGQEYHHSSPEDLRSVLTRRFVAEAERLGLGEDTKRHFRVHCLKHDLESLVLAAPDALRKRLRTGDSLRNKWVLPVENQNDKRPPKEVVKGLFKHYLKKQEYNETTDALWILKEASLDTVLAACRQSFAPFVRELRALAEGGDPDATPPSPG